MPFNKETNNALCMVHSMCDLKVTQMNLQHGQIMEFMFYEFELNQVTQNICCVKGKGTVDHSRETRRLQIFCLGGTNFDDLVTSGRA